MKPLFLICFLLMSSIKLFGQVLVVDSLKVNDIMEMGHVAEKEGAFDRALSLFDSAVVLANEMGLVKKSIAANIQKAAVLIKVKRLDQAEKLAMELMDESIRNEGEPNANQVESYHILGQVTFLKNDLDKSFDFYKQGLEGAKLLGLEQWIATINMNIGIIHCKKDNFKAGLACFNKSGSYQDVLSNDQLSRLYNCYAGVYKETGNNAESLEYLIKSLQLLEGQEKKDWLGIAKRYTNLAFVSISLEKTTEALSYLSKSNRILKQKNLEYLSLYLYNIKAKGFIYLKLEKWAKAEELLAREIELRLERQEKKGKSFYNSHLNLARAIRENKGATAAKVRIDSLLPFLGDFPLLKASAYEILANTMVALGDTVTAVQYYQKEIDIHTAVFETKKHSYISETYTVLAGITHDKDPLYFYKKALNSVVKDQAINNTPQKILDNKSYIDLLQLAKVWQSMSNHFLKKYKQKQEAKYLDSASYYIGYSSIAVKIILGQLHTAEDKKNIIKSQRLISVNNIEIARLKNQLQNTTENGSIALNAMEDNKSIILQSVLKEEDINQIINLSEEIQSQKKSLEESMALIQKEIIDARGERNENLLFDLEEELFEKEIALKELQERIEKQYPKYKQLLGARDSVMTIEGIRKQLLQDHTGLIEYLVTDSTVYQVIVTKEEVRILDLELKKTKLDSIIDDFRKSISDYTFLTEEGNAAQNLYIQRSYELYEELLEEGLRGLEGIRKLIIIPDYTIGHIPFEALTMSLKPTASYEEMDYLLHKYQVRYSYSTQMLYEGSEEKDKLSGLEVLGMAGSYDPVDSVKIQERKLTQQKIRKTLIPLPAVLREVDYIAGIAKGTYYTGIEATEANFKKHAGSYGILHLAMHGVLNTEHPMASAMIFTEEYDSIEDNFLYGHEIAQMDLEASLVVLSACETGYGKFEQGEGVMSMARSFMYAGVPSAVVSLWQVNDVSTSIIMKMFYEYLGGGLSKSEALTAAKQEYLQNVTGIAAHPAFWAAFVCIGEDSPLVNTSVNWYWWIGGGVILVFLVVLGLKRRNFLSKE